MFYDRMFSSLQGTKENLYTKGEITRFKDDSFAQYRAER